MTPAIGIEPMKPMTTMRFRFMERKGKEEGKTSNIPGNAGKTVFRTLPLNVERFCEKWSWANDKFSNHPGWIPRNDRVGGDALRNYRSSRDDRVLTDCHAFENDRVHADPDIVRDVDRSGTNG